MISLKQTQVTTLQGVVQGTHVTFPAECKQITWKTQSIFTINNHVRERLIGLLFHMAKRKPTLTLVEMERKPGYEIDSLNYPDDGVKRFYSDLRPVPNSVYERTKKGFEEH